MAFKTLSKQALNKLAKGEVTTRVVNFERKEASVTAKFSRYTVTLSVTKTDPRLGAGNYDSVVLTQYEHSTYTGYDTDVAESDVPEMLKEKLKELVAAATMSNEEVDSVLKELKSVTQSAYEQMGW